MVKRLDVEGLTPEVLQHLYNQEGLTETEIAQRFGVTQVQVGRFRKRWGIPTRSKADRAMVDLLPLTEIQQQVLLGSLLGDGSLSATSTESARYTESHSDAQEAYLKWKVDILGPLVAKVYRTEKRDKAGKVFHGWGFVTKSCPLLKPWYDLFYPEPLRRRVFPADLASRMTPLALAVWYMDDGSLLSNGSPRIAFGLDAKSLSRALQALKKLGLTPKVYGTLGSQSIHFSTVAFAEMVVPHLHPSMQYKTPRVSPRRLGDQNASKLTATKAHQLYIGGMSVEDIARVYAVGESTVKRRLSDAATPMRKSGPRRTQLDKQAVDALLTDAGRRAQNWASLTQEDQDALVDEVLALLRSMPFPYPEESDKAAVQRAFADVARAANASGKMTLERAGLALCTSLFPNRYQSKSRGKLSAWEAWHLDDQLRSAIAFQFKVGDPVLAHRVLRAVTMACRTPSVFRPVVAGTLYKTYCPAGGTVWDACMGFGGRLLGAAAAGVQYIGTDVDEETVQGNQRLADLLDYPAQVHLCPAQEFNLPPVDMVFTSPPYFNREIYSDNSQQSWRLGGFQDWLDGFLAPLVRKAYAALPPNGPLLLNVADVRDKGKVVPLVEATVTTALGVGFLLQDRLQMPLAGLNRTNPSEPVLVFRKPSVPIGTP